jgi:arylsulfatase A-like enzyme
VDTEKINITKIMVMSCVVGIAGGALAGQLDASLILVQSLKESFSFAHILGLLVAAACAYAVLGGFIMAVLVTGSCWALSLTTKRIYQNYLPGFWAGLLFAAIVSASVANGPLQQRFIEAAFILIPLGLCIAAGIVFFVNWLIDRLQNKPFVLPAVLLLIVWLVFLATSLWLISLNNTVLKETATVLRIIVNMILVASLAVLFKILIDAWRALMHEQKICTKRLIPALSVIFIVLLGFGQIVDIYAGKNSVMHASSITPAAQKSAMPNILWIVMDTVRADTLSCYGYHQSTTPCIDKIALEGVVFDNAFSTAPWTMPSHASMFTGMYPSKHQTTNNHQFLSSRFTTIAELLRANGYMTAAFSNNPWVSPLTNFNQGFDFFFKGYEKSPDTGNKWEKLLIAQVFRRLMRGENATGDLITGHLTAQQTNTQIKKWFDNTWNHDTPFFMFINYMDAHLPYAVPESYARLFLPKTISYKKAMAMGSNSTIHMLYYAGFCPMTKNDFDCLRSLYAAEINYLDHYIGKLCDQLRSLHLLDNTIIIITSDHGENFGENKKIGHFFSVDDRLLHVPLIIRYPKKINAGQRISRPVQLHQIFPTILDLIGLSWNKRNDLQGDGLFRENVPASFCLAELDAYYTGIMQIIHWNNNCFVDDYARSLKTIRDQRYKYIMASDGQDELYDMVKDPGESRNLSKANPQKTGELRLKLDALLGSFDVPDLKKTDTETIDVNERTGVGEALKSLGYVQ